MIRMPTDASVGVTRAIQDLAEEIEKLKSARTTLAQTDLDNLAALLRDDIKKATATGQYPDPNMVFRSAGATHMHGYVPDPGANTGSGTVGSELYLREDAQWAHELGASYYDVSDIDGKGPIKKAQVNGGLIVNGPLSASDAYLGNVCASFPMVRLTNTIDQSHAASGVAQAVTFDTIVSQKGNQTLFTTSANTKITFSVPCVAVLSAAVIFAASAAGTYRVIAIQKNGTNLKAGNGGPLDATTGGHCTVTTIAEFGAGQYAELLANQDSGGALNIIGNSSWSPVFEALVFPL